VRCRRCNDGTTKNENAAEIFHEAVLGADRSRAAGLRCGSPEGLVER